VSSLVAARRTIRGHECGSLPAGVTLLIIGHDALSASGPAHIGPGKPLTVSGRAGHPGRAHSGGKTNYFSLRPYRQFLQSGGVAGWVGVLYHEASNHRLGFGRRHPDAQSERLCGDVGREHDPTATDAVRQDQRSVGQPRMGGLLRTWSLPVRSSLNRPRGMP